MDRRKFVKQGCLACLGISLLGMSAGCTGVRYVTGTLNEDGILVDPRDFNGKREGKHTDNYVIVRHDDLQYPICVYKTGKTEYTALLMRCTHQGAELQAFGDRLACPAHGSEFDNTGKVMQGPAADNLRSFPVTVMNNKLFIDLRKPV